MQRSESRILTTHAGSLPRPRALVDCLVRAIRGEAVDGDAQDREVMAATEHAVAQQRGCGVDAGTDCGFDTAAGMGQVAADVVWEKLRTLRAGADLATQRLL